jgi:hypothetical protein
LNLRALARVSDIRAQLRHHLKRMRIPIVAADRSDRTGVALRKAITAVCVVLIGGLLFSSVDSCSHR